MLHKPLVHLLPVLGHGRRHAEVVAAIHGAWAAASQARGHRLGRGCAQRESLRHVLVRVNEDVLSRGLSVEARPQSYQSRLL